MMSDRLKIIFAGTPYFAVPTLQILNDSGFDIQYVLTQPDQKSGRGLRFNASPVKQLAEKLNIPIYQPETLKNTDVFKKIKSIEADIMVVAAYGLIIPKDILELFDGNVFNVHASLLPKWRGAAPIHRAIENGDKEIGITIMGVEERLDAGPMFRKVAIKNDQKLTTGELTEILAFKGAEAMRDLINDFEKSESVTFQIQDESEATYAKKILKEEAQINLIDSADIFVRKSLAFNPFPGIQSKFRGKLIKFWRAKKTSFIHDNNIEPGVLLKKNHNLYLRLHNGLVEIEELQVEGKKKMFAKEFISGYKLEQPENLDE
jgi:methionyl-tRNA formyltransferase